MTVVFGPDTFTVASDIGLALYPSGSPTYAYNMGSGTQLTVNAANDRIQAPTAAADLVARCTHASMPTGDQEVTATVYGNATSDNSGGLAVKLDTTGTANGYLATWGGGIVTIYRLDAGGFFNIANAARTYTSGTLAGRFKATGTNPVNVEAQLGSTAVVTFSDSAASRKSSGVPGVHFYNDTANLASVDNFQVDNLVAGTVTPQHTTVVLGQAIPRAALL